ncbi:MAG: hypothetical protein JWO53_518, partial [Chlamydiia bacterium]|nr:hypothetical protein [Chlamydiia bacterium]
MGIMASLNQNSTLFCLSRKKWIQATPEEYIRQGLLKMLREEWGYPSSLIMVEKEISQLPIRSQLTKIPKRRLDIVCYGQDEKKGLFPLLLLECKESVSAITQASIRQILGYNYYIGATFIGIACDKGVQVMHQDGTP